MKKLLILFFLASCVASNSNLSSNNTKLSFDKDLTFDEFDRLLIKYVEISSYPNIDK